MVGAGKYMYMLPARSQPWSAEKITSIDVINKSNTELWFLSFRREICKNEFHISISKRSHNRICYVKVVLSLNRLLSLAGDILRIISQIFPSLS